jgi:hypothetical protein
MALRRHLNESLFVAAPEGTRRAGRGETAVLVIGILVLAIVLQLLRLGPGTALNSIWAEDGPIFLQGAMQHGFWTDLWTTYAGYLVFAPRLIGLAASLVPLRDAAAAIALLSTLVVAVSGLVVWVASAAHIRSPWLRGTLVAVTILAPTAGLESVATGSYVLWFMLVPAFWLLLWRPRGTAGAALGGLFLLFTGLSTLAVWFYAPLAALRAISIRDRRDGILVGGWAAGAVAQVVAHFLQSSEQVTPSWTNVIWKAYLQRVLDGAALGERAGGQAWEVLGWALLAALVVLAAVGLWLGVRDAGAGRRWLVAIAVPTSIAMFVVSAYQRAVGALMAWPAGVHFGAAGRYTIVPALLLVGAALVLVEGLARKRPSLGRPLSWVAVAGLLLGVAISLDVRDTAARGTPSWRESLDTAAADCRGGRFAEVEVPVSPPSFKLTIPCSEVPGG